MPHECVNCGESFPDGSEQMLSGCSSCGGNKFQFVPSQQTEEETTTPTVGGENPSSHSMSASEDDAQRAARSVIVDDIPDDDTTVEETVEEQQEQESDTTETPQDQTDWLRQELNNQFESIRILAPGEYELDLRGLYEREDHVISLHDDGKYAVHINER